ncbi:hypothetical protein NQZ68_004252 [Dissostichus eleginoides]|nr:hypothetical protein NQZ68_004252 [Dissostichus eleginoides]
MASPALLADDEVPSSAEQQNSYLSSRLSGCQLREAGGGGSYTGITPNSESCEREIRLTLPEPPTHSSTALTSI